MVSNQQEMRDEAEGAVAFPSTGEAARAAIGEQTARAEQYLASWQRAQADLANFRKKTEQERQELAAYASAALLTSLLPVLDDLHRALETMDLALAGQTWGEGLKLVHRKFLTALEAQGLIDIAAAAGQHFQPAVHEAVAHVPGAEGVIIAVLQRGYRLRDRVLRPAMVTIGGGAPAPGSGG
ncbi:MAG: nucleotide exchange factor GrpE [Dehalococcoidia bacterium]|nr:nucleotide exchange factor GrpE [Dehalococcoidia bacterium]